MRRTALALFVVEPTQLRWGKLDLVQASQNSGWRPASAAFRSASPRAASPASSNSSTVRFPTRTAAKDAACCF